MTKPPDHPVVFTETTAPLGARIRRLWPWLAGVGILVILIAGVAVAATPDTPAKQAAERPATTPASTPTPSPTPPAAPMIGVGCEMLGATGTTTAGKSLTCAHDEGDRLSWRDLSPSPSPSAPPPAAWTPCDTTRSYYEDGCEDLITDSCDAAYASNKDGSLLDAFIENSIFVDANRLKDWAVSSSQCIT
jgi:hypothetical protein